MNNTVNDVNAQFAAERARQLAGVRTAQDDLQARIDAGTLVPLGDGRYRINDPGSFDHGEIWVQRGGLVLPEHGLDVSRGTVALYTTTPAWHQLGNVVPGGISSIDEVLRLGGIDFTVHKAPVLYRTQADAADRLAADHYVTFRDDTGAALGVVGSRYEVLQNVEVFEFLQDLVDRFDVVWESAGALRDGRRVFVSMRLPDTVRIDRAGIDDAIVPFIVGVNSHDGSSLTQVVVTPWRPACGNTERMALRDAHTRWGVRHTRNARERVDEARRTLGLSVDYFARFAREEQILAQTDIAVADFDALVEQLWPSPDSDAPARVRNRHADRQGVLRALWHGNAERLGSTAYAAERAVTEYCDWRTGIRPTGSLRGRSLAARATAALEGTHDATKTRAHQRLLTLVRR
ncbi:DUF932 domain-containing protein [Hamadaea sp. NPDC051192]|uniref:DUF932 domain-containing protein n=1 Tax=Hamadaea sp. NPDC051192 TaxID=3154940 RepID=UPI00341E4756